MRNGVSRVCAVGIMVVSALATSSAPVVASEFCASETRYPITVGTGSQPIVSTPTVWVMVCDDVDWNFSEPPEVYVEDNSDGRMVFISLNGSVAVNSVRVGFSVDGTGETVFVPINLGGGAWEERCLLYVGTSNPGTCDLFIDT